MREKILNAICIIVIVILMPYVITIVMKDKETVTEAPDYSLDKYVLVNKDKVAIEQYIAMVLAAEMPIYYEPESLKAQAVAARTYALKTMGELTHIDANEIEQAYITEQEMREKWEDNYDNNYSKLMSAINDTANEVMEYRDELVQAVFHSTSAGMTQGAEDVWGGDIDYLMPVQSNQDENSPFYVDTVYFEHNQIKELMKKSYDDFVVATEEITDSIQIIGRNEAGYVTKIQIGNKILSGQEFREILDLKSSAFTIYEYEEKVKIVTKGYGHGVGMSQHGANEMAKDGATYVEILKHYYTGVELRKLEENMN